MNKPKQVATHDTTALSSQGGSEVVPFNPRAGTFRPVSSTLTFTWEALERQLTELAVTPTQRSLAPTLVSGTRKQAAFKPPEMVLREVLCIAAALMDETFHPSPPPSPSASDSEEGEMT